MPEIEENTKIFITKNMPENIRKYYPIIEKVGRENNYFIERNSFFTFKIIMEDFGIDSIVYYAEEDKRVLNGCDYEIRITPYILIKKHDFNEDISNEKINRIRFDLYFDAWYGRGNIFSGQVNPKNLIGINLTERLNAFPDRPFDFEIDYIRCKCEQLPENGELVEINNHAEDTIIGPLPGDKISDYQIRLLYNDPYAHFTDLISAFNFINDGLDSYFEFIMEE